MSKPVNKKKANKSHKQGLYSADVLRDKIYKKGDTAYILLFPYNEPDLVKIFAVEILRPRQNADFTVDYSVKITNAFDKREALKDFFHNNWFRTSHHSKDIKHSDTNEGVHMFTFLDSEMLDDVTDNTKFKYGEYKTFFKNHAEKFLFYVNEAFIFDNYFKAMEYQNKLSVLAVARYLKMMHDIMISKALRQGTSALYTKTTTQFIEDFKPVILKLLQEMGPDYRHYQESKRKLYEFFEKFIIHRKIKLIEFNKFRKLRLQKWSQHDLDREGEN
jgi:G:T/U-mismatch repair DNA glycosylase